MISKHLQNYFLICFFVIAFSVQQAWSKSKPKNLNSSSSVWNSKQFPYPKVKTVDKTFSFRSAKAKGNVTFKDEYFWLEQDLDTPDVKQFIDDQTKLTESFMEKCSSKPTIEKAIKNCFDYPSIDNMWYFDYGLQKPIYIYSVKGKNDNRPIWYIATEKEMKSLSSTTNFNKPPGKKYLDEMLLSPNGTANINSITLSPDGKLFAYFVSDVGSDVYTLYFRSIDSPLLDPKQTINGGQGHLPDVIPLAGGSVEFTQDGKAFFYDSLEDAKSGYNTEFGATVRYHVFGTDYEKDITVIHGFKDQPGTVFAVNMSPDKNWLFLHGEYDITHHARTYACYLPGQTVSDNMKWISISANYDYTVNYISVIDDFMYFRTDQNSLNSKISKVKLDFSKAKQVKDLTQLKDNLPLIDVIPEKPNSGFRDAWALGTNFAVLEYIEKGRNTLYVYNLLTGKLVEQLLEKERFTVYYQFFTNPRSSSVVVIIWNLSTPRKVYQVQCSINGQCKSDLIAAPNIKGVKDSDFVTDDLMATSKDGTQVPYYVTYRKDFQKGGDLPCWMHFYAAYGLIETFLFSPTYLAFLNLYGGCFVWVSARGGGDQGEKWHEEGMLHNKQNSFDDITAVAKDLILRKYVKSTNLIADGGSAGGLAAGVVANQDPSNTFGLVLPVRAALDSFLRARTRGGAAQIPEFGNVNDPEDFDYIFPYSPYQNINPSHPYPAMLLTPAAGDQRAVAANSFKYLARVQRLHPDNPYPLLMHLVTTEGHISFGTDTDTAVIEATHQLCVAELSLGLQSGKSN